MKNAKRVTGMQPYSMLMGVPGGLLGKQSQSGNIRFTVGQYGLFFFDNSGTIRKSRANFFPPP
jgi:hypothetical protein